MHTPRLSTCPLVSRCHFNLLHLLHPSLAHLALLVVLDVHLGSQEWVLINWDPQGSHPSSQVLGRLFLGLTSLVIRVLIFVPIELLASKLRYSLT